MALLPRSGRDPALVVVWTEKEAVGTRLLWSRSDDSGASFTAPKSITGTEVSGNRGWEAIATERDGAVVAVWLDHREQAGTHATPMHQHDGPALAVDPHNAVHILWPTLVSGPAAGDEPELALFYSSSRNGRQFTPRYRIPTQGTPRHPQMAVSPDGSLAIAWDEQLNGTRRVVAAEVLTNGGPRFIRVLLGNSERGEYPVVAGVDDALAWTGGVPPQTVIRVQRFTASQKKQSPARTTH